MLVVLRRRELGVDETDVVFLGTGEGFVSVHATEEEVHGAAELEILEEGDELHGFVLPDDLEACAQGFRVLVDGYSLASPGDGEAGCESRRGKSCLDCLGSMDLLTRRRSPRSQ